MQVGTCIQKTIYMLLDILNDGCDVLLYIALAKILMNRRHCAFICRCCTAGGLIKMNRCFLIEDISETTANFCFVSIFIIGSFLEDMFELNNFTAM